MKYISIQDLLDYGKELRFQSEEQMKAVYDRMPSIEIIRCKDCKFAEESDEREWLLCSYYGDQWNEEDHWCSYAERKENG